MLAPCPTGKSRQWSEPVVDWCLTLWLRNKGSYDQIRQVLLLPSGRTLSRRAAAMRFGEGICRNIFDSLRAAAAGLSEAQRVVMVLADEVHLQRNLDFNAAGTWHS